MVFAKLSMTAWPEPCGSCTGFPTLSLPCANCEDCRNAVTSGAVSSTGISFYVGLFASLIGLVQEPIDDVSMLASSSDPSFLSSSDACAIRPCQ